MFILNLFRGSKNAVSYEPGQIIFREGEPGDSMYVILEGEIEIRVHDKAIDTSGPGQIIGEMALVDKSPRSATAVAKNRLQSRAGQRKAIQLYGPGDAPLCDYGDAHHVRPFAAAFPRIVAASPYSVRKKCLRKRWSPAFRRSFRGMPAKAGTPTPSFLPDVLMPTAAPPPRLPVPAA